MTIKYRHRMTFRSFSAPAPRVPVLPLPAYGRNETRGGERG